MKRLLVLPPLFLLLAGCGKSWPADHAASVTNSVKSWVMVEKFCAGPGDHPLCTPANVTGLAHGSVCPEASALYRHGDPLPPLAPESCPVPK